MTACRTMTEALPREWNVQERLAWRTCWSLQLYLFQHWSRKSGRSSSPRSEYDFWHDFAGINIDVSVVDGTVGSEKPPLRGHCA